LTTTELDRAGLRPTDRTTDRQVSDGIRQSGRTLQAGDHAEPGQQRSAATILRRHRRERPTGLRSRWQDDLVVMPVSRSGQIIFLNGASSSGKTSIAEHLLRILDRPYFHMSVDAINSMRAKEKTLELDPAELSAVLTRTRAGFHRAVAGMAQAGNDVIADHVLSEQWRLLDCLAVMADCEVVFVGVRCSDSELARRERARGDREAGQAVAQQHQVHAHGIYDIECDTTMASSYDCAVRIRDFIARRQAPTAFDRLRSSALSQPDSRH
jgi:chloramphenicol 3-O phosphotransferase